jgi:hypothetical protein
MLKSSLEYTFGFLILSRQCSDFGEPEAALTLCCSNGDTVGHALSTCNNNGDGLVAVCGRENLCSGVLARLRIVSIVSIDDGVVALIGVLWGDGVAGPTDVLCAIFKT